MIKIKWTCFFFLILGLFGPQISLAQTPSDLAALSLQDLMGISIDEMITESKSQQRWNLNYSYQRLILEGYRTGRNNLSDETVLFRPPEVRTATNYPILPTVITQEVHAFSLNYKWDDKLQLGITAPYITQSTDHKSIVPGFSDFEIETKGIGDVSLSLTYKLPIKAVGYWTFVGAVSLPTGSVNEKGDTPRNGLNTLEQLPYTMQLGSGTYDFPIALKYNSNYEQLSFGGQINACFRTGKNSHNYRLGNNYGLSSWMRWTTNSIIHPSISIAYRHTGKIKGMDSMLTVPGAFMFPANITEPSNYGADKVDLGFSLRLCRKGCQRYVDVNASKAIYQRLNGIQIKEGVVYSLSAGINF